MDRQLVKEISDSIGNIRWMLGDLETKFQRLTASQAVQATMPTMNPFPAAGYDYNWSDATMGEGLNYDFAEKNDSKLVFTSLSGVYNRTQFAIKQKKDSLGMDAESALLLLCDELENAGKLSFEGLAGSKYFCMELFEFSNTYLNGKTWSNLYAQLSTDNPRLSDVEKEKRIQKLLEMIRVFQENRAGPSAI